LRGSYLLYFEAMSAKGQVRKADEHKSIAAHCSMAAACVTPGRWPDLAVPAGRASPTAMRAHGVLSGILADAVKAKRLVSNPSAGIDGLPRKTARRHVYLSSEDV
jgi:hypothetical protein